MLLKYWPIKPSPWTAMQKDINGNPDREDQFVYFNCEQ